MTNLLNLKKKIQKALSMFVIAGYAVAAIALGGISSTTINTNAQGLFPAPSTVCPVNGCPITGTIANNDRNSLSKVASQFAQYMALIMGSIAIVFILYGAFIWMTNEKDGPEKGRKIILNAVIALVVASLSFGLLGALLGFLNAPAQGSTGAGAAPTQ
jgi:heme A synthase